MYSIRGCRHGVGARTVSDLSPLPNQFPSASGSVDARRLTSPSSDSLYDRNFALVLLSQIFFTLANNLMAHYARWIDFLGGSVETIGWIMGVGAIVGLALRPWMAELINRFGARTGWVAGHLLFGAGSIGSLFLHQLDWAIYICRASLILGSGFAITSSLTYITQTRPAPRRTSLLYTSPRQRD